MVSLICLIIVLGESLNKNSKYYVKHKKIKRSTRLKRRRLLLLFFALVIFIFCLRKIYVINKCKDLNYAANYYFVGETDKNGLSKISKSNLVFSDTDTAEIKAYGLTKGSPHKKICALGIFRRDSNNIWKLDSYSCDASVN